MYSINRVRTGPAKAGVEAMKKRVATKLKVDLPVHRSLETKAFSDENLRVKALEDGSVYIEGYANRAIVDRGKDLINKKAWKLDNYKKNPIILFNHDHSKPIGKMFNVEADEQGLAIKGRISNSKDPEISRIRDLVKEGILNSLSVGMIVDDEENKDGVNYIKSCELHEVSIVAVPMNQESQFTVSAKALKDSLAENLEIISRELGRSDLSLACKHIGYSASSIDDMSRTLSDLSGVSLSKAKAFLKMQIDTPKRVKNWLKKFESEKAPMPCGDKEEMKATDAAKAEQGSDVYAIQVPKSAFSDREEMLAWAADSGWKTDQIEEDDTNYLLVQNPKEDFVGDIAQVDMGDEVIAFVGTLADDSASESETEDENEPIEEPADNASGEGDSALKDRFMAETEQAVSGGEGNPPSWVADETLWETAKRASEHALGKIDYAFVVWWYLDQGGEKKSVQKGLIDGTNPMLTQPIEGNDHSDSEVNPSLDQAKQTNVLLSNAIMLLQQILETMTRMQPVTPNEPIATPPPPVPEKSSANETDQSENAVKKIEEFMTKATQRLRELGL